MARYRVSIQTWIEADSGEELERRVYDKCSIGAYVVDIIEVS